MTQDHCFYVRLVQVAVQLGQWELLRLQNYVSRSPNHDVRSLKANDERSQSTIALPSGSRNIAWVPLSDSVGRNSKKTPLARRSS